MATIKLYGHPQSTCGQRVVTVLTALGVPFELELINLMKGEHKNPEYIKTKQPFGKVPVLQDGEIQIFESRSIIRYLANKYKDQKNLVGETPKEAALIDNWLEAESQNFNPPVSSIVAEKVFKPMFGLGEPDEAAVSKHLADLEGVLDAYEAVLSDGRPYIAGERFSIADISHLPYGVMLVHAAGISEPFEQRPHVKAWWARITSNESWQKVVSAE